jgi:cell division septation protein DedD
MYGNAGPAPSSPWTPPQQAKKKHRVRNVVLAVLAVFVILIGIGAAVGSKPKSPNAGGAPKTTAASTGAAATSDSGSILATRSPSTPAAPSAAPPATSAAPRATSAAPTTTKPPKPAPTTTKPKPTKTKPSMTVSQQSAIDAANSYLDTIGGFSRKALIGQLSSKYGAGFSLADATYAVDHINIDYNAQALQAAKSYMTTIGGFSRAGLISQLTSSYGARFTLAQATYAVNKVGL